MKDILENGYHIAAILAAVATVIGTVASLGGLGSSEAQGSSKARRVVISVVIIVGIVAAGVFAIWWERRVDGGKSNFIMDGALFRIVTTTELREQPSEFSTGIGSLEVGTEIYVMSRDSDRGFYHVTLKSGKRGYVKTEAARPQGP